MVHTQIPANETDAYYDVSTRFLHKLRSWSRDVLRDAQFSGLNWSVITNIWRLRIKQNRMKFTRISTMSWFQRCRKTELLLRGCFLTSPYTLLLKILRAHLQRITSLAQFCILESHLKDNLSRPLTDFSTLENLSRYGKRGRLQVGCQREIECAMMINRLGWEVSPWAYCRSNPWKKWHDRRYQSLTSLPKKPATNPIMKEAKEESRRMTHVHSNNWVAIVTLAKLTGSADAGDLKAYRKCFH